MHPLLILVLVVLALVVVACVAWIIVLWLERRQMRRMYAQAPSAGDEYLDWYTKLCDRPSDELWAIAANQDAPALKVAVARMLLATRERNRHEET